MNLINLLKNYKGSLYSLVHGEVKFSHIKNDTIFCDYESSYGTIHLSFFADGRWVKDVGECILFPSKKQKQWSKFFKDGDIIASDTFPGCVYVYKSGSGSDYYYGVTSKGDFCPPANSGSMCGGEGLRLANQNEINRLYNAVIKAGYFAIDAINLVKAQFQEGDYIKRSGSCGYYQVLNRTIKEYVIKDVYSGNISTILGDRQWKFTKISSREGMICVSQYGVIYLCNSNYKNHSDYDTAYCYCGGNGNFGMLDECIFRFSRLANAKEVAQFIHTMKLHHCDFDFVNYKLTFIPLSKGERVLFRNSDIEPWIEGIIVEMNANKFTCVDYKLNMGDYTQCIPDNTITRDFTNCKSKIAPEFYKTW